MMRLTSRGIVAALACMFGLAALAPIARAEGHDSNTFHKLGKAIQYPFRKAGENTSVTLHRAYGQNSVMHRRNGNKTYRTVVTPKGHLHRLHRVRYHEH